MKFLLFLYLSVFFTNCFCSYAQDRVPMRIMTYNIRFGELASLHPIGEYIAQNQPDFVALQELDCMTRRDRTPHQHNKNFITELGFYTKMFPLYGKTIPYKGGYYGIGMLTKYPYTEVCKVMLPKQKETEEDRALLWAEIELPSGDTIVYASTHLDYSSSESRYAQLEQITRILEGLNRPVILGGDFNATPRSTEIKTFFKHWKPLSDDNVPTSPASQPQNKIDFLFGFPTDCWRLLSTKVDVSSLSDHLPVLSEIEFVRQ